MEAVLSHAARDLPHGFAVRGGEFATAFADNHGFVRVEGEPVRSQGPYWCGTNNVAVAAPFDCEPIGESLAARHFGREFFKRRGVSTVMRIEVDLGPVDLFDLA